ncbi:uncharacterized protein [Coffea arabica]|uniref:SAM domain-containing protein n=1 Tax=Coffea arabica TaxID=13443 RepID=A0A6P6SY09_COFAR|nr:uncharacterized protein LOC113695759 [Coffea arabica]
MDWCSWLSKANLEPSLTYEYGLSFTRNELEKEDLVYFNHEFLKSLGINVAKHRLEILKLVRKDVGGNLNGLSRLVLAFNKTKKLFVKKVGKWGFPSRNSTNHHAPSLDMCTYPTPWSGALRRFTSAKEDKPVIASRDVMKSGPLDSRVQQEKKMMLTNKCLSISGPLDGKLQDRWMLANWSPMRPGVTDGKGRDRHGYGNRSPGLYAPWEGRGMSPMRNHYYEGKVGYATDDGGPSLWSLMFQDLKPN